MKNLKAKIIALVAIAAILVAIAISNISSGATHYDDQQELIGLIEKAQSTEGCDYGTFRRSKKKFMGDPNNIIHKVVNFEFTIDCDTFGADKVVFGLEKGQLRIDIGEDIRIYLNDIGDSKLELRPISNWDQDKISNHEVKKAIPELLEIAKAHFTAYVEWLDGRKKKQLKDSQALAVVYWDWKWKCRNYFSAKTSLAKLEGTSNLTFNDISWYLDTRPITLTLGDCLEAKITIGDSFEITSIKVGGSDEIKIFYTYEGYTWAEGRMSLENCKSSIWNATQDLEKMRKTLQVKIDVIIEERAAKAAAKKKAEDDKKAARISAEIAGRKEKSKKKMDKFLSQ